MAENNEDSVFDQLKKWFLMSSSEKEVMSFIISLEGSTLQAKNAFEA